MMGGADLRIIRTLKVKTGVNKKQNDGTFALTSAGNPKK